MGKINLNDLDRFLDDEYNYPKKKKMKSKKKSSIYNKSNRELDEEE